MNLNGFKDNFKDFQWPWYMPSISEYKVLVNACDFKNIEIWEENADRFFASRDDMIQWIDQPSLVPFLKIINESQKDKFRNSVIAEMIKKLNKRMADVLRHCDGLMYMPRNNSSRMRNITN